MFCPSCHTQNRENAKFCKSCGYQFADATILADTQLAPETPERQGTQEPTLTATMTDQAWSASSTPLQQDEASAPDRGSPLDPVHKAAQPSMPPGHKEEVDISDAPTQILSPQQMLSYQSRRWQRELEREEREAHTNATGLTSTPDVENRDLADMPTVLTPPVESSTSADAPTMLASATRDSADIPTILYPQEGSIPIPPPPPPASLIPVAAGSTEGYAGTATVDTAGYASHKENNRAAQEAMVAPANNKIPASSSEKEGAMEQGTSATGDQETHKQAQHTETTPSDFHLLAVGTTIIGRYEVTQVLQEEADEHVYQVTDHQGYQRCWHCGSAENAEDDQFCSTCGAGLLDASYILHEYAATAKPAGDSHVLQGTIVNTFIDQGHTYVVEQPQATQTVFPNGVRLVAASDSDAGNVRRSEPNEDSTLVLQLQRVHESVASPVGVFIVADGMGGHENGQGASRMAIGTIADRITRELIMPSFSAEKSNEGPHKLEEDELVALLYGSVQDANNALCQANQRAKSDMGSTLTGFMIAGDHAYIINVGDSRTYMLRDRTLYPLTTDHSLVGQLVAGGLIEPDDVYTHPNRSQIYRSLGDKPNVQIDIVKQQLLPGDIILSCSDGLWEMVRNPEITQILNQASDPQTACTQLIEVANINGGEDNISAVIVYVR
ncbi:MAG: zinc-ribbon domain-containing protein [Chloroflexi bacterium]|nr:MAG: zinc-ribbon domain-containing protein [Chloroflexota bacterium]